MSADDLLAPLDPEQREVATALRGPVRVLAGAGTGKTRAITHRIAYGVAGDRDSVLASVSLDGAPIGPRRRVPLLHPALLEASADGLFWGAFRMADENSLELSHLDAAGELAHPTVTIPLESSRTRAPDLTSRLLRNPAATPIPTSHRPSRTVPGVDLR